MAQGGHRHRGGSTKVRIKSGDKEIQRIKKIIAECVEAGVLWAKKVLTNTKKVKIKRLNKFHVTEEVWEPKYSPELKIRLLELLTDKLLPDIRDHGPSNYDPNMPRVVGFAFTPVRQGGKDEVN